MNTQREAIQAAAVAEEATSAVIASAVKGFIRTGCELTSSSHWTLDREPFLLETSHPEVFAAGDVRLGSVKRCAAGVVTSELSLRSNAG